MANNESNPQPKKIVVKFTHVLFSMLLIIVFVLTAFLWSLGKPKNIDNSISVDKPVDNLPPGVIKAPTPYLILPTGREEYQIKGNSPKGDAVGTRIVTDPLTAPKGADQTFSIDVEHTVPVKKVTLELDTDTQSKKYPMSLTDGTDTKGTWSVTWKTEDTTSQIYYARFIVVDSKNHETIIKFPIR